MAKIKEIVGCKFGKLTILNISEVRGNRGQIRYDCSCDCGNTHTVSGESIRSGKSKSCGCNKFEYKPKTYNTNRENQIWKQLYKSTIEKRSKKNKWEIIISMAEFVKLSKQPCLYCGISPFIEIIDRCNIINADKDVKIFANGIDRVNSDLGYVSNNCVSCCKHCNTAKNTMTDSEFKDWIIRLYKNYIK